MTGEIFSVTFFADYAATSKRWEVLSLEELASRIAIASAPVKDRLPWLKLATFGDMRSRQGSRHRRRPAAAAAPGALGDEP